MCRSFLVLTIIACGASTAFTQLPQTRLYSVFPPGIAPGQISELRVLTGDDLDEVDRLIFNHPGIFATQKHQPGGDGQQQPVANTFRVAVDATVPPGRYEVRAAGRFGVSNPRPLLADPRPGVQESEPNNDIQQAQAIAIGTLVNGLINGAGDVDCVRVTAKRGQRLVIECLANRIDSRLNAVLTLADADGRPVAFAESKYRQDAVLVYDVPADGDYLIRLHDETFAGSSEHLYQLRVHTGPHIQFVMPPAGVAGTKSRFRLYGYNLPDGERLEAVDEEAPLERLEVDIAVPARAESLSGTPSYSASLDAFSYHYSSDGSISNSVRIGIAAASTPVILEQEPNNETSTAQHLSVPVEIGGQFTATHDVDVFTIKAKKGEPLWIEIVGQRGGGMIDPFLRVQQVTTDKEGNQQFKDLTNQDDVGTNLAVNVFDTATDDPAYQLNPPESGTYRVVLRDRAYEHRGDPSLVYRLIIRRPQPDFRLVAVPAGQPSGLTWPVCLRRGDHFSLDLLAFRRDGFDGPIEVRPRSVPFGLSTQGTVIREKENRGTLVLTAKEAATFDLSPVDLVGSASVSTPLGEETVQQPVRFGGVVWSRNGNTPAISQLESEFSVALVPEAAPFQVMHEFQSQTVHQGRQLLIPINVVRRGFDEKLAVKIDGIPKSAKIDKQDLTINKGESAQTLRLFVNPDSPPGTYVVTGTAEATVPYRRNPERAERLAAEQKRAVKEAQHAKSIADEAAARLQKHVAALEQANSKVQQAEESVAAAREQLKQAQQAIAQAQQKSQEISRQVTTLTEQAKEAADVATEEVEIAGKSEDPEAKTRAEAAQQSAVEKQSALESARQAQADAEKRLDAAQSAGTNAEKALTGAMQELSQAESARQPFAKLKAAAEVNSQEAAAAATSAAEAQKAAEKAATDAANAVKPKNFNVTQPIPPFLITVNPAPIVLEAKPAKLEVKQGESVEVTVTAKRQDSFSGPVKLTLSVPENVSGISAEEATIAADADSVVLKLMAAAEAVAGDIANVVVRGVMDAGGEAIVDVPVSLKVTK